MKIFIKIFFEIIFLLIFTMWYIPHCFSHSSDFWLILGSVSAFVYLPIEIMRFSEVIITYIKNIK